MKTIVAILITFATGWLLFAEEQSPWQKDFEKIRVASEAGDSRAMGIMSFFIRSEMVPRDPVRSAQLATQSAELGSPFGKFSLALVSRSNERETLFQGAYEGFQELLRKEDDPYARFFMARCLHLGLGAPQDEAAAVGLYRKGAEKGEALAQYSLGYCFESGQGVSQDQAEAVRWYRKAAVQGLLEAQNRLALCLAEGQGVVKDEIEAVHWFRKTAEQGLALAQFNLGICYAHGKGVAVDQAEAVRWYRKAADQGNADAQYSLGFCLDGGYGAVKDDAEAVRWLKKAAQQGHVEAQEKLDSLTQKSRSPANKGS